MTARYHPPENELTLDSEFALHWQMTNCERFAIQDLLRRTKPKVALEIGTYKGGSLQVISHFAEEVYSIDIDPTVPERLGGRFPQVHYRIGPSGEVLPKVLAEIAERGVDIGFVLIDGDHSTAGVRDDINKLLAYIPKSRCIVIMHDSFNPDCREGIRTASWGASPYVHMVDLDFIPGIFHEQAYDTAAQGSMWGGFGIAVLEPTKRTVELEVRASQHGLFDAVYQRSSHKPRTQAPPPPSLAKRILRKLGAGA